MVETTETPTADPPATAPKPKKKRTTRKKTETQAKQPTPSADVTLSRCPGCDSTDRTHYSSTIERRIDGEHDGKPFTHVLWKRCRCRSCGQSRVDIVRENRAP